MHRWQHWYGKAGMVHFISGWTLGVQVKMWDPLRMRAIPEHLRGVFTTRRYTNSRLPLALPLPGCDTWQWKHLRNNQEHSNSTDLRLGRSSPDPESVSGVQIWSVHLDSFQNLTGTSSSKDASVTKFSWIDHSFQRCELNCGEISHLAALKNLSNSKISRIRIWRRITSEI